MAPFTRYFVFFCLNQIVLVKGKGRVVLTLLGYDNPTGQALDGCCDTVFSNCLSDKCDPYFQVCFTRHGSRSACDLGKTVSGVVTDSLHEVFTDMIGRLPNPLVVQFDSYQDILDINVTVMDKDYGGLAAEDDLMDVMGLEYTSGATPFGAVATPSTHVINGKTTTLLFNLSVECTDNYYDPGCNTWCMSRDDISGHYTCNENGSKICMTGWQGSDCDTPIHVSCNGILVGNVCQEITSDSTTTSEVTPISEPSSPTSTTSTTTLVDTSIQTSTSTPGLSTTTTATTLVPTSADISIPPSSTTATLRTTTESSLVSTPTKITTSKTSTNPEADSSTTTTAKANTTHSVGRVVPNKDQPDTVPLAAGITTGVLAAAAAAVAAIGVFVWSQDSTIGLTKAVKEKEGNTTERVDDPPKDVRVIRRDEQVKKTVNSPKVNKGKVITKVKPKAHVARRA